MVLQDTWLFEGTIQENDLQSGACDRWSSYRCSEGGRCSSLYRWTLPQGYDTVLMTRSTYRSVRSSRWPSLVLCFKDALPWSWMRQSFSRYADGVIDSKSHGQTYGGSDFLCSFTACPLSVMQILSWTCKGWKYHRAGNHDAPWIRMALCWPL